MSPSFSLTVAEARAVLLAAVGPRLHPSVSAVLQDLGMIQIDPIDRVGTNADLVALARVDGLTTGEVYGVAGFEHFAKERCLLPPSAYPYYRVQAARTPHWRSSARMRNADPGLLKGVLDEVRERGPVTAAELSDHGQVVPGASGSPGGWNRSNKSGTLALEVLWVRCALVVSGRRGKQRIYDTPERALPSVAAAEPAESFLRWAVRERIRAAGILSTASGPWWSMIKDARKGSVLAELVEDGDVIPFTIGGAKRVYYARAPALEATPVVDSRMRMLGPLDPLVWNRPLVQSLFGFEYLWEVYKPAAKRRWGYYVCPLLHEGRFVGRIEARRQKQDLVVGQVWREDPRFDDAALEACLDRHARALGCRLSA